MEGRFVCRRGGTGVVVWGMLLFSLPTRGELRSPDKLKHVPQHKKPGGLSRPVVMLGLRT